MHICRKNFCPRVCAGKNIGWQPAPLSRPRVKGWYQLATYIYIIWKLSSLRKQCKRPHKKYCDLAKLCCFKVPILRPWKFRLDSACNVISLLIYIHIYKRYTKKANKIRKNPSIALKFCRMVHSITLNNYTKLNFQSSYLTLSWPRKTPVFRYF